MVVLLFSGAAGLSTYDFTLSDRPMERYIAHRITEKRQTHRSSTDCKFMQCSVLSPFTHLLTIDEGSWAERCSGTNDHV